MNAPAEPKRLLASYGRRRGRKLRPTKQGLFDTLLPTLTLELPNGQLDLRALFAAPLSPNDREAQSEGERSGGASPINPPSPNDREARSEGERSGGASPINQYFLEIGFGAGEHLAHQASLRPDTGIIGCEPYVNGIAGLLKHIDTYKLTNIRIYPHDARLLIEKLPDACMERVFILYPDPWPKARHHKRRLISTAFLTSLARVMKEGAQLRLATDSADYCTWMLERLLAHPDFVWTARSCDDWLNPWYDWIETRYEQKRLAGMPTYLTFARR